MSHTADAAGGEAIYSSDGLSPIPIPQPPPVPQYSKKEEKETIEDGIDYGSKNAIEAFEVFSGKVFPSKTRRSHGGVGGGKNESRLERLARIQAELEEMEEDDLNENQEEEEKEIMSVVNDLTERLRVLQNGVDVTKRQQQLTSVVNQLSLKNDDDAAEIQKKQQESQTQKDSNQSLTTQEQRLLKIEQMLGSQMSPNVSVLERLKQAEGRLKSIDEKTLTQAASRAKVIRADLEAAAKARSKLNNTNVDDEAKVTKLHNQLVDMDGFLSSNILSTIVNRLSTCASLHSQSMEFGKDLKSLEDMVKDVEVTLGSVEESVKSVESGLVENMKVIQKNMDKLDQNL